MDYIKIRFGNDLDQIATNLERSIDGMFRPRPASPMFASCDYTWTPQMDIYETPQEIIVRAEIAGVDKEDLEVEINRKAVRISGKRCEMPRIQDGTYRLAEIQYGSFERVLYLPASIDTEVVSSSYSSGFLEIRLAKLPTNVTHRILIEDG